MNYLGKYIQKKQNELNMSEREIAKLCKVSHSYLNQLIKGVNPTTKRAISPTVGTLEKLSLGLNISVENLQKINNGLPEESLISDSQFRKEIFLENIEKNATSEGIPVGSNSDRIIPWRIWEELKQANKLISTFGLDPSESSQEDWVNLLDDIVLVIKLHAARTKK